MSNYIQQEAPIDNPHELELHYLMKDSIAGFNVNRWTRIKSARKKSEPKQDRFVVFHIDTNTLAEEAYEFDLKTLQKFLNEASREASNIVDTHLKRMV